MKIIKLNAIDSTNSYLKKLVATHNVENYTVVLAKEQTVGRGQMGTSWVSEQGKNLTFSILIKVKELKTSAQFYVSMAISLAILEVLNTFVNASFFVKWPNDILAEKDKVAGILIENTIQGNFVKQSIVGIGLNVHQEKFSKSIGNATSLKNISGKVFEIEELLAGIVNATKKYMAFIENKDFEKLKKLYLAALYKFETPMMFEDLNKTVFLGKIVGISKIGQLLVSLENETVRKFNLKEIKFANR